MATYAFHECEHVLSHLLSAFPIGWPLRRRMSTMAGTPLHLECLRRSARWFVCFFLWFLLLLILSCSYAPVGWSGQRWLARRPGLPDWQRGRSLPWKQSRPWWAPPFCDAASPFLFRALGWSTRFKSPYLFCAGVDACEAPLLHHISIRSHPATLQPTLGWQLTALSQPFHWNQAIPHRLTVFS
jgi:hypothetical protein